MISRYGAMCLLLCLASAPALSGCDGGKKSPAPAGSASTAVASLLVRIQPARVGRKAREVRKGTQKLGIEFWSAGKRMGVNESSRLEAHARTTEVLGLVGRVPAKVRVTYDRFQHEERRMDGKSEPVPRLAGRTFVIDVTDGSLRVSSADGSELTESEVDTLKALHAGLGKEDPVVLALVTKAPHTVGKATPLREPLLQALVASKSGTLKEGTVTLKGVRSEGGREVATFGWAAVMNTKEDNGLQITWHLRGEFAIAVAESLLLKSTIDASLDAGGSSRQGGATIEMQGSGTMQQDEAVTLL